MEEHLDQLYNLYRRNNWKIKILRYDAGSTGNSKQIEEFLNSKDISLDSASVESQFQNPVERQVQTILKMTARVL